MESQMVIRYAPPVQQALTPRRVIVRSRTGCGTCRSRKKKCDEADGSECKPNVSDSNQRDSPTLGTMALSERYLITSKVTIAKRVT